QYDRQPDGTLTPLPKKNIDTGVRLERLALVLQGVIPDSFKTDLFLPYIKKVEALSGKRYGADKATDRSMRIVVEHGRSATFLIADGIQPSNEWRGYVLRRLIRRASMHARPLGLRTGILAALGTEVVKHMQQHYPELTRARDRIPQILGDEEAKFERTLENGLEQLTAAIESAKGAGYARIDGDTAFRLFDTFGFPLEMTREIAAASGLTVDEAGYRRLLEAQRSRSRASAKFSQDVMRFGQLYSSLKEREGRRRRAAQRRARDGERLSRATPRYDAQPHRDAPAACDAAADVRRGRSSGGVARPRAESALRLHLQSRPDGRGDPEGRGRGQHRDPRERRRPRARHAARRGARVRRGGALRREVR